MKKIIFIVNPISGVGKQKGIEKLIAKHLNRAVFDYSVVFTEKQGHATELSRLSLIHI